MLMPKICEFENCQNRASYGYYYEKPLRCKDHKGDMKPQYDICMCGKSKPNFNYENEKRPKCCKECKDPEMIDIVHPKCIICKKIQPTFNYPNEKKRLYCSKCATEDMVDVIHPKCIMCKKNQPNFNYPNETKPLYCSTCKKEDMIDIIHPKCITCNKKRPSFNYSGENKPLYCRKCSNNEMIDIRSKKCKGQDGLCTQQANKKYKGYCSTCFAHYFPNDPLTFQIRCKTKEIAVRDFINANYEGFHHDKQLSTGHCDCTVRRRIDHRKLIDGTLLVIETDENQHKSYDKMDEETRYDDLYMAYSGKWIYIRFNPDKYKNKKGENNNPTIAKRLARLKKEIDKQVKRIEKGENKELVERVYLYYDEFS